MARNRVQRIKSCSCSTEWSREFSFDPIMVSGGRAFLPSGLRPTPLLSHRSPKHYEPGSALSSWLIGKPIGIASLRGKQDPLNLQSHDYPLGSVLTRPSESSVGCRQSQLWGAQKKLHTRFNGLWGKSLGTPHGVFLGPKCGFGFGSGFPCTPQCRGHTFVPKNGSVSFGKNRQSVTKVQWETRLDLEGSARFRYDLLWQEIVLKCAKIALVKQKSSGLENIHCKNNFITPQIKRGSHLRP